MILQKCQDFAPDACSEFIRTMHWNVPPQILAVSTDICRAGCITAGNSRLRTSLLVARIGSTHYNQPHNDHIFLRYELRCSTRFAIIICTCEHRGMSVRRAAWQRALERCTLPSARSNLKFSQISKIMTIESEHFLEETGRKKWSRLLYFWIGAWGKTKLGPWPRTYLKGDLFVELRATTTKNLQPPRIQVCSR